MPTYLIINRRPADYTPSAEAEDLAAATALATGCPVLGHGGGVEVGELTETR